MYCPRWHRLECVAHRVRGGAWVRWDERVDLTIIFSCISVGCGDLGSSVTGLRTEAGWVCTFQG
jgi:hypothetical protein